MTKLLEYADAGIEGYWLIDLEPPVSLTAFTLVDGDYQIVAETTGTVTLPSPEQLVIDVTSLTARR